MSLQLQIASHSEIGPVRKNNQDSGYASPWLLVVADGMGGAAAGDLASAVAVDTIRRVDGEHSGHEMLEMLSGALDAANDRIADLVRANFALEGMGTTVTGVLFDGTQFGLAHIGDSRAYLLHEGRLERLTHDHSWVQSLVDDGRIDEGEAAVHPHRSLLLKVLNGQPANDPDLTLVSVVAGDRLLLCSDGLCGLVDDPVIERAMQQADLDTAMRLLVDEALAEGGVDNITVVLADVVDSAAAAPAVVLGAAAELQIPQTPSRTPAAGRAAPAPAGLEDTAPIGDESGVPGLPGAAAPGATAVVDAAGSNPSDHADDEARYSPQPPRKRRFLRPLAGALVLLLVVGAGLGAAYAWTRTQFYVGAAGDRVAIFQGLSDRLPGVPLSRLYEVQPLAVSALPPYYQDRVRASIDVADLTAARQTVGELGEAVKRCELAGRPTGSGSSPRAMTTPPTGSPSPSAAGTPSATPRSSPRSSPMPTGSQQPTATSPDVSC